jgi:hypothetical protein
VERVSPVTATKRVGLHDCAGCGRFVSLVPRSLNDRELDPRSLSEGAPATGTRRIEPTFGAAAPRDASGFGADRGLDRPEACERLSE